MVTAAKIVVVECEELVEMGEMDPNKVHIPGVFVHKIFKADPNSPWSEKKIERLRHKTAKEQLDTKDFRIRIATRASKEIKDGMSLNLGIGIPTLIPSVLPPDSKIDLHS